MKHIIISFFYDREMHLQMSWSRETYPDVREFFYSTLSDCLANKIFFKQCVANMVGQWFESVAHCQSEEAYRVVSGMLAISI